MESVQPVAYWMRKRGLELTGLVQACGLDRKVVEAIVEGRYTTSPRQRERVAAALGVSPGEIAWGAAVSVDPMYGHGPQFGRSP